MDKILIEFIKNLKPKEKIVIISSMAALAVVLICVVFIIAFCGTSQHIHDYDCRLELVDGKFNFIGECDVEGCDKPRLYASNVKAKQESQTASTCAKKGETVFAYTYKGYTGKYIHYAELLEHTLGGKKHSEIVNSDGSVNFDVAGVKLFPNTEYVCLGKTNGFYNCDACSQPILVQVYKPTHTPEERDVTYATCTEPGTVHSVCKLCDEVLSEPYAKGEPAGHKYEYLLSGNSLAAACSKLDCDHSYNTTLTGLTVKNTVPASCSKVSETTYTAKQADGKNIEFVIYGTDMLQHTLGGEYIDVTIVYDYGTPGFTPFENTVNMECGKTGGAGFTCEVCDQLIRVDVKKPDHDIYLDYDKDFVKPSYETAGVIYTRCQNDGCDLNLREELPKVLVKGDGKNATVTAAAGDATVGLAKYSFSTLLGLKVEIEEVVYSAALGHNYTYTITNGSAEGLYNVYGVCENDGCGDIVDERDVSDRVVVDATYATCQHGSRIVYSAKTSDGRDITFYIEDSTKGEHRLNGKTESEMKNPDGTYTYGIPGIFLLDNVGCGQISKKGAFFCDDCESTELGLVLVEILVPHDYDTPVIVKPTLDSMGSIILTCKTEDCVGEKTYDLPKVEIGVNAVQDGDSIKYTYYIEGTGYTVELTI